MTLKALMFGSIGTLCSTSDLQLAGYNRAFSRAGLDWSWDRGTYETLLSVTGGKQRLPHYAALKGLDLPDDAVIDRIHRDKTDYLTHALRPGECSARPGVARLIRDATAHGIKLAFVTTTERQNINALAAALDDQLSLSDFAVITDRDMVQAEKPDPEVYRLALSALSCHPNEVIAIEDTAACLDAAVEAGIRCIATPHAYSLEQSFDRALAVLTHLGEEDQHGLLLQGQEVRVAGRVTIAQLQRVTREEAAYA